MLSQTGYEKRGAYYLCPECSKPHRRISDVNRHMNQKHGKKGLSRVITFCLPERLILRMERAVSLLNFPSRNAFVVDVIEDAVANRLAKLRSVDNPIGRSKRWRYCNVCGRAFSNDRKLHEHVTKQHPVNRP